MNNGPGSTTRGSSLPFFHEQDTLARGQLSPNPFFQDSQVEVGIEERISDKLMVFLS